ncbi:hypothetical protein GCM10009819_04970 [Agromyces tropicus]|uniref:Cytochrome bc1 complex Rieske iron-sulfur subunit n=1 Tax=Agromyces tropicus TaxID=555371 RepID=A0ABP5FEE7_9MICO
MDDARELSRRTALVLGGGGVAVSALTLAGCAPSSGSAGSTGSTGDSGAGSDGSTGSDSGGGTTDAAGEEVAALSDIPVGGSIGATIGGAPVLLSQPTEGDVVAFSAICTHQGCQVGVEGGAFVCPCHGSVFDAATGAVEQGPALDPLPSVAVMVDGDRVIAG